MEVMSENNDLISGRSNEIDNIPIFTEEFLEHNKKREAELRHLKKMTTDCEENNAMLQKHVEDINTTISQLESEINQKKLSNAQLLSHLNEIKKLILNEFKTVPIPGTNECPNEETIESYIQKLQINFKPNSNAKEMEVIKQKIANVLAKYNELA